MKRKQVVKKTRSRYSVEFKKQALGISLAIESGNDFLRDHVLFRHMPGELIEEGCRKILDRGMTLRTEQILAVPFSDTHTDLATLGLNNRINPTMMWTSILAPYAGTDMGTIASNFGLYEGDNDDLSESFFDKSVLRHVEGGPRDIEAITKRLECGPKDRELLAMKAIRSDEARRAGVVHREHGPVGHITYLDERENAQYCQDTVRLQRLANFLAKVPDAELLGRKLLSVPEEEWTWKRIGEETSAHLNRSKRGGWREMLTHTLARQMGFPDASQLPEPVAENPYYFAFFPAAGVLARSAMEQGVFGSAHTTGKALDQLGTIARRHLFTYGLYKIKQGSEPIAA